MKNIGFLNNVKIEVKDAKKGIGKSVVEVKKQLDFVLNFLTQLEENMEITSSVIFLNDDAYKVSNINVPTEGKKVFREIIFDLYLKKIIVHKRDLIYLLADGKLLAQDTQCINEMIDGKNIIIIKKSGFRKYVDEFKKIFNRIHEFNEKKESIAPNSFMSRLVSVPKKKSVFVYNTKEVVFLKNKRKTILNKITGFSLVLFVYFLNNSNIQITEQQIEFDLESFLRTTGENRGTRSTYTAVAKLDRLLKASTGKKWLRFTKNTFENTWIFEIN